MKSINKVIVFLLLLLTYLGLSKAISPTGLSSDYVFNHTSLEELFPEQLVSVVLIDYHSTGFIIKTHYHKYRIVYGFKTYEEKVVRVSSSFKKKHLPNIGRSIFRRLNDGTTNFIPLPPGSVFIGNTTFGNWVSRRNKERNWTFYRVYKHLKDFLGWYNFKPSYSLYQQVQVSIHQNKLFEDTKNLFGTGGSITRKSFPRFFKRETPKTDYKNFFKEYLKQNFNINRKVSI